MTRLDEILRMDAEIRAEAQATGREVISSRALPKLFGRAESSARVAKQKGKLTPVFNLTFGKAVHSFFSIPDCIELWGDPDPERLAEWRARSVLFGLDGRGFAVLTPVRTEFVTAEV